MNKFHILFVIYSANSSPFSRNETSYIINLCNLIYLLSLKKLIPDRCGDVRGRFYNDPTFKWKNVYFLQLICFFNVISILLNTYLDLFSWRRIRKGELFYWHQMTANRSIAHQLFISSAEKDIQFHQTFLKLKPY